MTPLSDSMTEQRGRRQWETSHRFDRRALPLADRHYNRRKVGSPQFVPPGRCLVLITPECDALWVTSWPFAQYVRHSWAGAWVNSLFRNESEALASELIRDAVAATCAVWHTWEPHRGLAYLRPAPPPVGLITFVDASKTRRKRDPGRCYRRAGFHHVGFTKGGLWAFQLLPADFPDPRPALDSLALTGAA